MNSSKMEKIIDYLINLQLILILILANVSIIWLIYAIVTGELNLE